MASRYSVKIYADESFYHIYNRGVEKRNIFLDDQDYAVFLSYLQTYLMPKEEKHLRETIVSNKSTSKEKDKAIKLLRLKNYYDSMELLCYACLPNHFHLLVRQKANVLNFFMNSIGTRYGMYFNRKYKRTGVLFQDVYKAVLIENDEQLLQLSRYIHLNPIKWFNIPLSKWQFAPVPFSLAEYVQKRKTDWIKTSYILDFFSKTNQNLTYEKFLDLPLDTSTITPLTIDYDLD